MEVDHLISEWSFLSATVGLSSRRRCCYLDNFQASNHGWDHGLVLRDAFLGALSLFSPSLVHPSFFLPVIRP
jgi:hypothetical protein